MASTAALCLCSSLPIFFCWLVEETCSITYPIEMYTYVTSIYQQSSTLLVYLSFGRAIGA
jgi:hypothetical protein